MRAIAALLVAVLHISERLVDQSVGGGWLLEFSSDLNIGHLGVSLFFMVSGFVIPASLHNQQDRAAGLRTFAIRRFFRLYPAYWLSIGLAVVVIWWLQNRQPDPGTVLANLTMVHRLLGFRDFQGLYWTLLVELIFYVACAALYAMGLIARPRALVTVLCLLIVWFAVQEALGFRHTNSDFFGMNDLPPYLGLMFCGALLRFWHDGQPLDRWVKWVVVVVLALYILPIARGIELDGGGLAFDFASDSARALGVVLFLVLAMRVRLAHPVLSWLGTISYSIYLLHMICAQLWISIVHLPGLEMLQRLDLTVAVAVVVGMTLVLAAITYRWVELPMIELGRRLSRPTPAAPGVAQPRRHA